MVKVAVFASGNGSNFEALVRHQKHYEVACLIVDQEDAYAIERAKQFNIQTYVVPKSLYNTRKAHEEAILEVLDMHQVKWICLAGYMRIIGHTLISKYPNRIINIHPSLLPAFPGRHAIKDAYHHGVKITGVTIFYVDQGIDTGKIITQEAIHIKAGITLENLEKEIHVIEHRIYSETLEKLIGGYDETSTH